MKRAIILLLADMIISRTIYIDLEMVSSTSHYHKVYCFLLLQTMTYQTRLSTLEKLKIIAIFI